jgi:hypothetical protein
MKKRTTRIVPPINKQTAFELIFGYDGKENKKRLKPLVIQPRGGKLNGVSI